MKILKIKENINTMGMRVMRPVTFVFNRFIMTKVINQIRNYFKKLELIIRV